MSHLSEPEQQLAASCSKTPTVLSSVRAGAGQGFFCTSFFCPSTPWVAGAVTGNQELFGSYLSHFCLGQEGAAIQCKREQERSNVESGSLTGKVPKTTGKGGRKPTLVLAVRVVGFDTYQKAASIRVQRSALWVPKGVILPVSFGKANMCL